MGCECMRKFFSPVVEEMKNTWAELRQQKPTFALFFAIFCVLVVIVGNVIILIATNFWLTVFPADELVQNSSQIAIQVVAMIFMVLFFSTLTVVFAIVYGTSPLWHILVDSNRRMRRLSRVFLLFASGATNGISSLLAIYAMSHTPEFLQAVLLCSIPFFAQAWTVVFIKEERKRNYLALFFIAAFLLFVAGVLLSSISAFLNTGEDSAKVEWAWTLIYLLSCIIFGLWCVVQRLYLDGIVIVTEHRTFQEAREEALEDRRLAREAREPIECGHYMNEDASEVNKMAHREQVVLADDLSSGREGAGHRTEEPKASAVPVTPHKRTESHGYAAGHLASDEDEENAEDEELMEMLLEKEKRHFADTSVDATAAKVVLLVGGLLFQLVICVVLFPIDAIPWYGTSNSALDAWHGFRNAMDFVFASWHNVKYGLLNSLGCAMSFFGCTYLNEHSPTLASVVLQLAGPITSIVILIVPQWNVYKDFGFVGQKIGGVILLFASAVAYHFWEQQSMRQLMAKAEAKLRVEQEQAATERRQQRQQQQQEHEEA